MPERRHLASTLQTRFPCRAEGLVTLEQCAPRPLERSHVQPQPTKQFIATRVGVARTEATKARNVNRLRTLASYKLYIHVCFGLPPLYVHHRVLQLPARRRCCCDSASAGCFVRPERVNR